MKVTSFTFGSGKLSLELEVASEQDAAVIILDLTRGSHSKAVAPESDFPKTVSVAKATAEAVKAKSTKSVDAPKTEAKPAETTGLVSTKPEPAKETKPKEQAGGYDEYAAKLKDASGFRVVMEHLLDQGITDVDKAHEICKAIEGRVPVIKRISETGDLKDRIVRSLTTLIPLREASKAAHA